MNKVGLFLKENWVLVLSFIYILSPIDLIPGDMVTGVGLIDDLGVLILAVIYAFIRFVIIGKKDSEVPVKV
ncbi:MAG: DUF1232 domain-containing protein [Candidatus Dojkabacteria bacterium]|jgi:uncharacterized membrane protein YkvA (DUF1232 family)|nr:DUF1232 domain-containing protein [Candidatus Dojkabacteria bacterium]